MDRTNVKWLVESKGLDVSPVHMHTMFVFARVRFESSA